LDRREQRGLIALLATNIGYSEPEDFTLTLTYDDRDRGAHMAEPTLTPLQLRRLLGSGLRLLRVIAGCTPVVVKSN
jgi:hypothetical protein